jgi:hypothetical protein
LNTFSRKLLDVDLREATEYASETVYGGGAVAEQRGSAVEVVFEGEDILG